MWMTSGLTSPPQKLLRPSSKELCISCCYFCSYNSYPKARLNKARSLWSSLKLHWNTNEWFLSKHSAQGGWHSLQLSDTGCLQRERCPILSPQHISDPCSSVQNVKHWRQGPAIAELSQLAHKTPFQGTERLVRNELRVWEEGGKRRKKVSMKCKLEELRPTRLHGSGGTWSRGGFICPRCSSQSTF